ncbi:aminoglycoside phosphotransferase family protein [Rhodococcus pyridinivorans]|uniref:phosphotransferase family protein n=1 Tax=Rhodococcus TaxID=1827 RepID=UPI001C7DB5FF|nr:MULTISPECIES: phosphotransferase [Rhodococcus]MBX4170780.1 aminoglycoside phosphotransferase family protein [Rhodococcus sp. DMU2021]UVT24554.1 aminoglycoside phosphotransferase family protein [Rhodococcus pyridinivorans]
MPDALERLTPQQRHLLTQRFGRIVVVSDMSWGLVSTTVLEVDTDDGLLVVKAGGTPDRHIGREISAHERWTAPWVRCGRAARMVFADRATKLVVTEYLPGRLVLGTAASSRLDVYEQAGALLAQFHRQEHVVDEGYERSANTKTLRWLAAPHRIGPDVAGRLRSMVEGWPTPTATLVPTHGDWQSRNWLADDIGVVKVIDFGRAGMRPAGEDFERLAVREFLRVPGAEQAFLRGYGEDPREEDAWFRRRVRAAVAVAVWAFHVGDDCYEAEGHRMIAEALGRFPVRSVRSSATSSSSWTG